MGHKAKFAEVKKAKITEASSHAFLNLPGTSQL